MNGIEIIPVPVAKWSIEELRTFLYRFSGQKAPTILDCSPASGEPFRVAG